MRIFEMLNRFSQWLEHAPLVAMLILISRSDWILSNIYHDGQSLPDIFFAIGVLICVVLLTLIPLVFLLSFTIAETILRMLTASAAVYAFWPSIRALPILPLELGALYKIGLMGSTITFAWLLAVQLPPNLWRRMQIALFVGSFLYITYPMVAARMTDQVRLSLADNKPKPRPTVVLLLDELNADDGDQIVAAIAQSGAQPRLHLVKAVGSSTITVIPEILGGPHMPQARVCTPTAICDRSSIFDFSNLRFNSADRVHIVGFFHPYCDASGLASCTRLSLPGAHPVADLICSFGRLLPGKTASDCDWFAPSDWQIFRTRAYDAALRSPFWREGGTLYAHLPFPHPPGNLPDTGLAVDYAHNVQIAARIAANIWARGHSRFGKDFRLIVTSDHPLRSAIYCRHKKYHRTNCKITPSAFEGLVPYIEVGTSSTKQKDLLTNTQIFEKI